ncbi:uncharacterized protein LOC116126025 [Pistacia vera]|uniref:uncharacterized protein LOC116126025 n=1 Tax=Pistacia vera TaxID=55513 RepID=UPI001262FD6E|nr:uncharacterized protein LOC116126025 [Pistacia vera]
MMSTTTCVEISQYDGKMDFNTWKKKMKALLSHNKVGIALEKDGTKWSEEKMKKKVEIDEEAYNLIIMNLSDSILRKVDGIDTPIKLWGKLETLYALKSAPNLAFLKGAMFSYKMDASKSLEENLDEFLKMTLVLKGTDQELGDSSLTMILLNSLPDEYLVVKNALQKQKHTSTESNLASSSNSIEITEALTVSSSEIANEWVLDSGCFFHLSPNKTWFQNLITGEPEMVFMGNNHSCRVQGIGTLDETGCSYRVENGCITVYKNDQILFEGVKRHDLGLCETCVMGKQHRSSFPKGTHLSVNCLEYLQADLWGLERVKTHGGNSYFLAIVDDFSRKVWVYLLRSKDEALSKFKGWKTLVENQQEKKVKALRTDNALEFCNTEFDAYC